MNPLETTLTLANVILGAAWILTLITAHRRQAKLWKLLRSTGDKLVQTNAHLTRTQTELRRHEEKQRGTANLRDVLTAGAARTLNRRPADRTTTSPDRTDSLIAAAYAPTFAPAPVQDTSCDTSSSSSYSDSGSSSSSSDGGSCGGGE